MNYKDAGVDIERADRLVQAIARMAKGTRRPGVLGDIGGFGGLFEIPVDRYRRPVLVSGTDGVGTKLKLAVAMQQHSTIGIDLVAMCANDILTLGAEPLFFLDYFATPQLNPVQAERIIQGIAEGCKQAKIALLGGETAEMPGLYQGEDYDLAGFCVGIVDRDRIIDGTTIQEGDQLVALPSSGPHSNGYSLIRHIISQGSHALDQPFGDKTLGEVLLTPTRIYVDSILRLLPQVVVRGLVHVTGGGLIENTPRILPEYLSARIFLNSWQPSPIFPWLQTCGRILEQEMFRTFNMGVGMMLVVRLTDLSQTLDVLAQLGEAAWHIGDVQRRKTDAPRVVLAS